MPEPEPWALALFRRSVLKQRKLAEIAAALGPTEGLRCLDLGSDNGVVSLLLRRRGGRWASADLTDEAVASIRQLVADDVHRLGDGAALPFADAEFDRVVVVDMLEHVADEPGFVAELARVTKPGGRLIVNTPHRKDSALRRLRHAIGQTDEKHGHLRPGYTPDSLAAVLAPRFRLEAHRTYSAVLLGSGGHRRHQLGRGALGRSPPPRDGGDRGRRAAARKAFRAILSSSCRLGRFRLDGLLPWTSGYMLIGTATRLARVSSLQEN